MAQIIKMTGSPYSLWHLGTTSLAGITELGNRQGSLSLGSPSAHPDCVLEEEEVWPELSQLPWALWSPSRADFWRQMEVPAAYRALGSSLWRRSLWPRLSVSHQT